MLVHADPIVTLSAASYAAFENETSVEVCAVLTLLASTFPSGLPSPGLTVELSTTDGTAGTCSYMVPVPLNYNIVTVIVNMGISRSRNK